MEPIRSESLPAFSHGQNSECSLAVMISRGRGSAGILGVVIVQKRCHVFRGYAPQNEMSVTQQRIDLHVIGSWWHKKTNPGSLALMAKMVRAHLFSLIWAEKATCGYYPIFERLSMHIAYIIYVVLAY